MGSARISVVAVIDLDGKNVRLVVTGTLTRESQIALHPLIRLGRVLTPVTRVVVDLTDARITEAAAVDALTRHACEGHTGHPSQQVRFLLPAPAPPAPAPPAPALPGSVLPTDAEDLRQLRIEQRSWAAAGAETDQHSTVRHLDTAPAHLEALRSTDTAHHRLPGSFPDRRTAAERLRAGSGAPRPATGTQHVTTTTEPTGTVLPFRPPRSRRAVRSQRNTAGADRTTPGRTTAR